MARRTWCGSVSPASASLPAMCSTMASRRARSPAVVWATRVRSPAGVARAQERDVAALGLGLATGFVGGGIGGDDAALDDVDGAEEGQAGEGLEDLGVDDAGLLVGQGPGGHGGLAGLPVLDLAGHHRLPDPGESVAQVEHVAQQHLGGGRRGLQQHAELDHARVRDQRRAVRTHLNGDAVALASHQRASRKSLAEVGVVHHRTPARRSAHDRLRRVGVGPACDQRHALRRSPALLAHRGAESVSARLRALRLCLR